MNQKCHGPWLWIILILLVVVGPLFSTSVSAGTKSAPLPETFRFAKHLYDAGQFGQAAEVFEKFTFETPDSPLVPQALYLAAQAYAKISDYSAALNACDRALMLPSSDLAASIRLFKSTIFSAMGATDQTRITLHNLMASTKDPEITNEALYRLAWLEIEAGRFDEAKARLGKISADNDYPLTELQAELEQAHAIPVKHPRLAGVLSLLPGAGQLYTGRYQDAAVAFILNTLLFWSSFEAFDEDHTALGLLLGGVGLNFYVGNIYSAVNSAHKFNRNARNRFIEQLNSAFVRTGISYHQESQSLYLTLNIPF